MAKRTGRNAPLSGRAAKARDLAMKDIHLLRMLVGVKTAAEVQAIMKGYGFNITTPDADKLCLALRKRVEMTAKQLVEFFNLLEVPSSMPEGPRPMRKKEWS
jgi:ABC-type arginine transport system ATPase subunit